jgi:hypothetical protein
VEEVMADLAFWQSYELGKCDLRKGARFREPMRSMTGKPLSDATVAVIDSARNCSMAYTMGATVSNPYDLDTDNGRLWSFVAKEAVREDKGVQY